MARLPDDSYNIDSPSNKGGKNDYEYVRCEVCYGVGFIPAVPLIICWNCGGTGKRKKKKK